MSPPNDTIGEDAAQNLGLPSDEKLPCVSDDKKKNFKRRLSHSNVNRTHRAKSYNDLIGNLQKFIDT